MVTGEEPGASVWPPMTYAEALLAVKCWEPIVRIGAFADPALGCGAGKEEVCPLMTMAEAEGARE